MSCDPHVEGIRNDWDKSGFWYLLKTNEGILGWAEFITLNASLDLYRDSISARDGKFTNTRVDDLNSDGKEDKVILKIKKDDWYSSTLTINDKSIDAIGDDFGNVYLSIIDIDKSDPYKEVAVHSPGPSDDDEYNIFSYDGKEIYELGLIMRWPEFTGDGNIIVNDWQGFWSSVDKYTLDQKSHKLIRHPQDLYAIGYCLEVNKTFPIYCHENRDMVLADLREGSIIKIVACDMNRGQNKDESDYQKYWYLIKSESGLLGWAKEDDFREKMDLPIAD